MKNTLIALPVKKLIQTLAILGIALSGAKASAQIAPYYQNFENLNVNDPNALANDGWLVYGNALYFYGYGPFPAPNVFPNGSGGFCLLAQGLGGTNQGNQSLVIYSDYNNADMANGYYIEANTYQERTISAADVGQTYVLSYDAKLGDLDAADGSTAAAFIKTIDPNNGYYTSTDLTLNMTSIPSTWNSYSESITITPDLVGQLLQFGFESTATHYFSSGVIVDNVGFAPVPEPSTLALAGLSGLSLMLFRRQRK